MMIGIIDIGSNSVRTMVAKRTGGDVTYSDKQVYTTRLAEGLHATGRLSDARMEQSLAVIARFRADMLALGAPVYAYATSAVRDASNREAFIARVRAVTGGPVDVLTGSEEARYAYIAATGGTGGMLDIGGGSTQLASASLAVSVPMGCVRAKDVCGEHARLADIRQTLLPALDAAFALGRFAGVPIWSGVGGTITTLSAYALGCRTYDKYTVSGAVLPRATLEAAMQQLDGIPPDKRAEIPLLQRRYDVILHGGAILLYLMERLAMENLRVSDADGMEGYAMRVMASPETCTT